MDADMLERILSKCICHLIVTDVLAAPSANVGAFSVKNSS
jgi:hypothetical protein